MFKCRYFSTPELDLFPLLSPKQPVEALVTIRLVALFLECSFIQLLQTKAAYEVLGMELPEHGGDAAAGDWFVAAGTQRPPQRVVVRLAVRKTLVLEEGAIVERFLALPAHEALLVPLLVQGRDGSR